MPLPNPPIIDHNVTVDSNRAGERIEIEYSQQLVHQRESAYPFAAFLIKMASQRSVTSKISWFDTRPAPEEDTLAAESLASATNGGPVTVRPANVSYFTVKDVIEFPDTSPGAGETNVGIVTATGRDRDNNANPDVITVRPYSPSLKLAANAINSRVFILYPSFEQGGERTAPSLTRPFLVSNNSTVLRHSYQIAKTTENERYYAAPERVRARAEKEIRHLVDLNKLLMFGKMVVDETYFNTRRTQTKGFENFVVTNVFSYGSQLTQGLLFDYMRQIHENSYGGDGAMHRRLVFCSSEFLSFVNNMTLGGIRFQSIPKTWGADITQLIWAGWVWDLVHDPTLTRFRQGSAFVMQPRYIRYRPFRPTVFRGNIQDPEVDYVKDEFLTEANYEHRLEEAHAIIQH